MKYFLGIDYNNLFIGNKLVEEFSNFSRLSVTLLFIFSIPYYILIYLLLIFDLIGRGLCNITNFILEEMKTITEGLASGYAMFAGILFLFVTIIFVTITVSYLLAFRVFYYLLCFILVLPIRLMNRSEII